MSDIIDKANQHCERMLARQIAAQRSNHKEPQLIIKGKHYCIDCEQEIPTARLAKVPNACRCVECLTIKESKDKHFA